VSEWLYRFPAYTQGQMTAMRSNLVREQSLYQVGLAWELDQYLIVGESVQVIQKRQIADVVEAFLAAYYLAYGFTGTVAFCQKHLFPFFAKPTPILSYKTSLQELVQAQGGKIVYSLINESGPSHDKLFTVQLSINQKIWSEGTGKRIALAEEEAAKTAYTEYIK
jgi:ribonuclease-3